MARRTTAKKTTAKRKATKTAKKSKAKRKVTKKKSTTKRKASSSTKVKVAYTKSELFATLSERTGFTKKEVAVFFEELSTIISAHLKKGGPEEFKLPGILKMKIRKTPARKSRKGINPFTGEMTTFKAKPAARKVKITALKNLKEMAK